MARSVAINYKEMNWSFLPRRRSSPHVQRKLYHMVMGLVCVALYAYVFTREQALTLLSVIGGFLVLLDLSRLCFSSVNRMMLRVVGRLMRREELKSISGNSFYILGLIAVVYFFPKPIVLLSVLFLAVGDPVAALVGTHYGKKKILGSKSLEGTVANWLASSLTAALFGALYLGLSPPRVLLLAVVGGGVSVIAELIPLPIDDNFTIPIFSAIMLAALQSQITLF